jgi:putative peptidoglycan lipid II flippase
MVERLLRMFNREWSGLHEAAFLLAGTALLSQILGLVRDRLLAHHFGAGEALDVYYAAFRVPDLIYASVASFVAVTVLIPFLLEKMEDGKGKMGETEAARRFIDSIFTGFVLLMLLTTAVTYVLIPAIGHHVVPGFAPAAYDEYVVLTRILLLSPLLLGISNLFGSVTQSLRRFFVFAAGPILYNIGIIVGILFLLPRFGIVGVVYGVIIGAAMHLLVQLPVLVRERIVPRFTFSMDLRDMKRVVTLSVPRTIALSATQLATIVLIQLASRIEVGSIAVFTLAMNLQSIPLSIVGMSYSVAAFPTLAKLWTGGNREQFESQIVVATRHILFWSLPAIVLFIVLRAQIVRSILGSGLFDWTATRLTAAALALFAISVIAQNLVLLFTRAFYAMGKTRLPLWANLSGGALIVLASYALLHLYHAHPVFRYFAETLLRVDDIPGTEILMLPLGYSLGMFGNVAILLYLLRREFKDLFLGIKKAFLHAFSASVVLGFVAYHSTRAFALILDTDTFFGIFSQGLLSGAIGVLVWVYLLKLMENDELKEIWTSLHHKFWKRAPIATEVESI